MGYIEKMRKDLKIHRSLRTYLDAGSNEFNQIDYKEKIQTLARIVSSGYDLEKIIKEYKSNYKSDGYKHIYTNVAPTLTGHISFINHGVIYDLRTLDLLEYKSEKEVIQIFITTIKEKVLPQKENI